MSKIARLRLFAVLICSVALLFLFDLILTPTAHADIGPKPSVIVTVQDLDGRACYGTLLSEYSSTGPAIAWDGDHDHMPWFAVPDSPNYDRTETEIWQVFIDFADADGYYYLQCHWNITETNEIAWTYYPPRNFKILLYFPDTQSFAVSEIHQAYAFHSYFNVNLNGVDIDGVQAASITAQKSYDCTWEIVSLFIRIVATVAIELGVAFLLRIRSKKQILTVLIVNILTQTALNITINVLAFFQGGWAMLWYLPLEIAVFVTEAVAYSIVFYRMQRPTVGIDGGLTNKDFIPIRICVLYSLCANLISFAAGFILALVIPGII